MTKQVKLKPLKWVVEGNTHQAEILGAVLSVYPTEHGKYAARINLPNKRPEMETSLDTLDEAKRYAERILLVRELSRYFIGI